MKFNCGAKRHHYLMFNVERSMFDLFDVRPVVTKRYSPLSELSTGCGWLLKMCAGYMSK
jgi:hypothetical protein